MNSKHAANFGHRRSPREDEQPRQKMSPDQQETPIKVGALNISGNSIVTISRESEGVDAPRNARPSRDKDIMQEKEALDERLPGLFEPDTLLPIQYFEAMRRKHLLEGEKRLVLSVLEDAVECYMKCLTSATSKGQKLFRDAEEWINLEDKRWVFSFDNVCEMLDINPEYMRRGLQAWKERKLAELAQREQTEETDEIRPVEELANERPTRHKGETGSRGSAKRGALRRVHHEAPL